MDSDNGMDVIMLDAKAMSRLDAALVRGVGSDTGFRLDFGDGRTITIEGEDRTTITRDDFMLAA